MPTSEASTDRGRRADSFESRPKRNSRCACPGPKPEGAGLLGWAIAQPNASPKLVLGCLIRDMQGGERGGVVVGVVDDDSGGGGGGEFRVTLLLCLSRVRG